MSPPPPAFGHLLALSDDVGVLEHARHTVPRREHGYCVDDNARALVVCARARPHTPAVDGLAARCLAFVAHAQSPAGSFRNRMSYERRWLDSASTGDWWGRALWGLGLTAASGHDPGARAAARELFVRGAQQRSPWPRAMAYAAIGAAALLEACPRDPVALELLGDAARALDLPATRAGWPWPEPRLTYANAVWPEALLAAGAALDDRRITQHGLDLLEWLVETESRDGHLSVTPVGGWEPGEARPGFDQQPIEVSGLAEACARAVAVTGDRRWQEVVALASAWFLGDNDAGVPLANVATRGGHDGLTATGANANQGAESTLALLATLQLATPD